MTNIFVTPPGNCSAIICFISDSEVSIHNGLVSHDVHGPVNHLAALLECLKDPIQDIKVMATFTTIIHVTFQMLFQSPFVNTSIKIE